MNLLLKVEIRRSEPTVRCRRFMSRRERILLLLFLFIVAGSPAAPAQNDKPFAEVDRTLAKERAGWSGSPGRKVVDAFNRERRRLGVRFETELLNYLSDGDADKHYWISSYIADEDFLDGNKPLPYLALLIMQQGLALLDDRAADDGVFADIVAMCVLAAILSEKMKLHALAMFYKARAEHATVYDYRSGFPAISDADQKLYDRIKRERPPPKKLK